MLNLRVWAVGIAAWALMGSAHAAKNDWPPENKTIQIVVPVPSEAGIGIALGRLLATALQDRLGSPVSVASYSANHGPAGTGSQGRYPLDGSTLFLSSTVLSGASLSLNRDPSDLSPRPETVGMVAQLPNILVVNNDLPVYTLADFNSYVAGHPGVINFASAGNGSAMHLAGQLYMTDTESNMVHVAYSSSDVATINLISGQIQSMFHLAPSVLPQIKNRAIRAIGVMSEARLPALPQVPTMSEQGYPLLQFSAWIALMAPAGTPHPIIVQANQALNAVLEDPTVREHILDMGAVPAQGSPEAAQARLAAEHERDLGILSQAILPVQ